MSISRKDTMIIALFVNMALLAILFATANRGDEEKKVLSAHPVSEITPQEIEVTHEASTKPVDEIDQVLQEYALREEKALPTMEIPAGTAIAKVEAEALQPPFVVQVKPKENKDFSLVTVKKGDSL